MNVSSDKGRKRILGSMLSQHIGEHCCLLGTLIQLDPNGRMLKMKSTDDQTITVQLQQPPRDPIDRMLEVHGTVSPNNTIQCFKCIPFEDAMAEKFDMDLYNEAVELMNKHSDRYPIMS